MVMWFGAVTVAALLTAAAGTPEGEDVAQAARAGAPEPRWFLGGRTVTRVLIEKKLLTERTPSSCVVVAPSLPPCRGLRTLRETPDVQPAHPQQLIEATRPVTLLDAGEELPVEGSSLEDVSQMGKAEGRTLWWKWTRSGEQQPVVVASEPLAVVGTPALEPSRDGWNWRFWSPDTTVTKLLRQVETRKQIEPKMVITFSVTGCKPTKLPFDLELCDTDDSKSSDSD